MPYYAEPELEEAINAYWRQARREGYADCQINQPSRYSTVYEDRVVLESAAGYLGTYDLKTGKVYGDEEDRILVEGIDEDEDEDDEV